jgi:WD40 repeat protein
MHSHHDGEVWGLESMEDEAMFITSGDDNKLLMYDIKQKKCILRGVIVEEEVGEAPSKIAYKRGGAATTSSYSPDKQSRAIAWNSNYKHLAVADNNGKITIRQAKLPEGKDPVDANCLNNIIQSLTLAKEWIECMSYNPSMSKLAAGSHDNNIYIFNVSAKKYMQYCVLKAHTSFVTSLDWSMNDSPQYIRSNCGGYELLFFNVDNKKQDKAGASNTTGTIWETQSCKLGWNVEGIFPLGCDGTHINGVDESNELNLIATGDDYGLVNIYRNPVRDNTHQARSLRGHSEHVTRVKFSQSGEYMLSIGGMDQTVIQWKKTIPH